MPCDINECKSKLVQVVRSLDQGYIPTNGHLDSIESACNISLYDAKELIKSMKESETPILEKDKRIILDKVLNHIVDSKSECECY